MDIHKDLAMEYAQFKIMQAKNARKGKAGGNTPGSGRGQNYYSSEVPTSVVPDARTGEENSDEAAPSNKFKKKSMKKKSKKSSRARTPDEESETPTYVPAKEVRGGVSRARHDHGITIGERPDPSGRNYSPRAAERIYSSVPDPADTIKNIKRYSAYFCIYILGIIMLLTLTFVGFDIEKQYKSKVRSMGI